MSHTEINVPRNRILIEDIHGDVQDGRVVHFCIAHRKTDLIHWDGYIQWEPDSSTLIDSYVEVGVNE